jgi:hypothetical protein
MPMKTRRRFEEELTTYNISPTYALCDHRAETVVWSHAGRALRIADARGLRSALWAADAIVDCAAVTDPGPRRLVLPGSDQRFRALDELVPSPVLLRLDWPDGGVLPVGRAWWQRLWDLLPPGTVVVCCHGGHGRSGTAVAALMVVAGGWTADAAIAHVRKAHCSRSIETEAQEEYVRELSREG